MITINIDPVLLHLGPLTVSWHSLFIVVGIIAAVILARWLVKQRPWLSLDTLYSATIWGIPGGIVGARLVAVVDRWDYYIGGPGNAFAIWEGGLAIWGAIIGGAITIAIYGWVKKFPVGAYLDIMAPGLILAQAIGRIGDIINGEHFSTVTSFPWAVVYTHPNSPALGRPPTHPAVAYELLMDLVILGILWRLIGRFRPDGAFVMVYLIMYSVGRFFLSFLRLDSNTVFLTLNQPQWISIIVVVVAASWLVWRRASWQAPPALVAQPAVEVVPEGEDD